MDRFWVSRSELSSGCDSEAIATALVADPRVSGVAVMVAGSELVLSGVVTAATSDAALDAAETVFSEVGPGGAWVSRWCHLLDPT